jgi:hypothetical protein
MTGILLLLVVAVWSVAAYFLTKLITRRVPRGYWRVPMFMGIFLVLFALPVLDEIVGIFQFNHFCSEYSGIRVDRGRATGKTVYVANVPHEEIKGTSVRIVLQPIRFLEATNSEPVMSYNGLNAYGGWLIRTLGISEGNKPLLFRGSCWPRDTDRLIKEMNMQVVRR